MNFLADYAQDCSQCGAKPCVVLSDPEPTGTKRQDTELCGPCFFHDRLMIDPELWNEPEEATE
jgi:hypothetical protein